MKNALPIIATLSIVIFSAKLSQAEDYQSRPSQNAPVTQGWSYQIDGLALDPSWLNLFPNYTCQPIQMQGTNPNASVICECRAPGFDSYSYSVPVIPQPSGYSQTYLQNVCQANRPR